MSPPTPMEPPFNPTPLDFGRIDAKSTVVPSHQEPPKCTFTAINTPQPHAASKSATLEHLLNPEVPTALKDQMKHDSVLDIKAQSGFSVSWISKDYRNFLLGDSWIDEGYRKFLDASRIEAEYKKYLLW